MKANLFGRAESRKLCRFVHPDRLVWCPLPRILQVLALSEDSKMDADSGLDVALDVRLRRFLPGSSGVEFAVI